MLELTPNDNYMMAKAHRLTPLTRARLWGTRGEQETTLGSTGTIYPVCTCSVWPLLRI